MGRTAHRHILGAAGDRRHRRDLCCPFCRGLRSQQHRHHTHHGTGAQARRAQLPDWRCRKLAADAVPQRGADRPAGQSAQHKADGHRRPAPVEGFQPDEPDDLPFAHADAAHHAKELGALGQIAVHAAGDHQHSGQQHQHEQHRCHPVHGLKSRTAALPCRTHHLQVFLHSRLPVPAAQLRQGLCCSGRAGVFQLIMCLGQCLAVCSQQGRKGFLRQIGIHDAVLLAVKILVDAADAGDREGLFRSVRQCQRYSVSAAHMQHPCSGLAQQHFVFRLRVGARKGCGTVQAHIICIGTIQHHPLAVQAVCAFAVLIEYCSGTHPHHVRLADQLRSLLRRDAGDLQMPAAAFSGCTARLGAQHHVRHTEDGRDQEHCRDDAQDGQPVLPPAHPGRNGDQA